MQKQKYFLITDDKSQLKAFQEILVEDTIETIKPSDFKEVDASSNVKILYKVLEAGEGAIVQQSVLEVKYTEVVDIDNQIDDFEEGDYAKLTTTIAYNDGKKIYTFEKENDGVFTKDYYKRLSSKLQKETTAIETCFISEFIYVKPGQRAVIHNANNNFAQLRMKGLKDTVSSYDGIKESIIKFKKDIHTSAVPIELMQNWNGKYIQQNNYDIDEIVLTAYKNILGSEPINKNFSIMEEKYLEEYNLTEILLEIEERLVSECINYNTIPLAAELDENKITFNDLKSLVNKQIELFENVKEKNKISRKRDLKK